jgi:hypothetical protein
MAVRENTQADFDLERVMDLFDQALISKDERVVNALRSLLMIVALTASETGENGMGESSIKRGPFRQLKDDLDNLHRRINNLEGRQYNPPQPYNPYPNGHPGTAPTTMPGGGSPWWGTGVGTGGRSPWLGGAGGSSSFNITTMQDSVTGSSHEPATITIGNIDSSSTDSTAPNTIKITK